MVTKFINRRATLFVSGQLNLTANVLPKYISEFAGMNLLPSINKGLGIKITPKGIEPEEVISLDLKKLDETIKVSFGPDRVDIVSTKEEETWDSFRTLVLNISNLLETKMSLILNRFALCGAILYTLDKDSKNSVYSTFVKNSDAEPVEWSIRNVKRSIIQTPEKDSWALVNHVNTLTKNETINDQTGDNIVLDIDINTVVGSDINSLRKLQELFWLMASANIETTKEEYKSILKSSVHD